MMTYEPIFVAGPDRSGTSLLFSLLASHPNISMVRRTNMWRYFYNRYGDLSRRENFERCLTSMVQYKRMRHLKPDPIRIRSEFWQGEPTYGRLFALFHEHNAQRAGKLRWGDKSLHTEHHAEKVFAEYPKARIIHMIRDPRDRCASMHKRYEWNEGRVAAATGRWLFSTKMAKQNSRRYPDNYMTVRYETLASHPEETLRQICAFIDETYTPAMLTMDAVPEHRDRGGNSSFGQYEPGVISARSIGRFREVLSVSDIAFIQMFAGRDMDAYGYEPEHIQFSLDGLLAFCLIDLPVNLVRMVGWRTSNALRINKESIPASKIMAAETGANVPETSS
jgi:hypothetical protein